MNVKCREKWPYDTELKAKTRALNFLSALNFNCVFSRYNNASRTLTSYLLGQTSPLNIISAIRDEKEPIEDPILTWNSEGSLACVFSDSVHLWRHENSRLRSELEYTHHIIPLNSHYTSARWVNGNLLLLWSKSGFSVINGTPARIVLSFLGETTALHALIDQETEEMTLFHANERILKFVSSEGNCMSQIICDAPIHYIANNSSLNLKSVGIDRKIFVSAEYETEQINQSSALSNLLSIGTIQKTIQSSRPLVCGSVINVAGEGSVKPMEWSEATSPSPTAIGPFASHPSLNMIAFADLHSPAVYVWGQDSETFELEVFRCDQATTRIIGLAFVSPEHLHASSSPQAPQNSDLLLYVMLGEIHTDPLNFLAPSAYHYRNLEIMALSIPYRPPIAVKMEIESSFMAKMKSDLFQLALRDVDLDPLDDTEEFTENPIPNDYLAQIMQSMATMNRKMDEIVNSQQRIEMKLDGLSMRMDQLEKRD